MVYISCSELSQLVKLIAEHLHGEDLQTILVIPAMMRGSAPHVPISLQVTMTVMSDGTSSNIKPQFVDF